MGIEGGERDEVRFEREKKEGAVGACVKIYKSFETNEGRRRVCV